MYVTPPDTDVYAIPKVLAPMPQKVPLLFFFAFIYTKDVKYSVLVLNFGF